MSRRIMTVANICWLWLYFENMSLISESETTPVLFDNHKRLLGAKRVPFILLRRKSVLKTTKLSLMSLFLKKRSSLLSLSVVRWCDNSLLFVGIRPLLLRMMLSLLHTTSLTSVNFHAILLRIEWAIAITLIQKHCGH